LIEMEFSSLEECNNHGLLFSYIRNSPSHGSHMHLQIHMSVSTIINNCWIPKIEMTYSNIYFFISYCSIFINSYYSVCYICSLHGLGCNCSRPHNWITWWWFNIALTTKLATSQL
jgi:hypothetical protein